jgi:hypothetical protein
MPQAQTVPLPKRLPLYSPLQTRTSLAPFTKDSRLYNGYAEFDRITEGYKIFKRPGLGSTVVASSGKLAAGLGLYTESGTANVFSVFGTSLSIFSSGSPPVLTTALTVDGTAPYAFVTVGPAINTSRYVVLGNGAAAYYILFDSGPPLHRQTFAQITDPNFPTTFVPGWCTLDGFLYVMDPSGNIWGTLGPNNPTVWSSTNVIVADSNSDLGVALAKQLNYLIAFKQYTTQVFYDAGNPSPGSPLSSVPDAQLPLGCLVASSIGQIDNTLLWVTSNETISPQVVQMDNLTPKIVSTPDVDRILDNVFWPGNPNNSVRAWVLKHAGHRFYVLNLIANNITLAYDLDQKGWYIWTDFQGNFWPIVSLAFFPPSFGSEGVHLAQHATNGNVYPLDGDYSFPTDFGNIFPVDIYTPNFDGGTSRRKHLGAMYFNVDKTPGNLLQSRYSDDDYTSWSNFRTVDLSDPKPRLTDEGTFNFRRAYHFRHAKATALRLASIDLQLDIGTL